MIFENKNTNIFTLVFLSILLFLIIIVLILSLNRGFDFSDEGGYLLSYKNVNIYRGGIYNYHIIISKLTDWSNPGVKEYRMISLVANIVSSFVLAFGLYKWLNANLKKPSIYSKFSIVFCFITIGNFLCSFMGVQTFANNDLTNFILQVVTGLVLFLCSYDSKSLIELRKLCILSLIGLLCVYSFFVKFSTGILQLTAYLIIFVMYVREQPLKFKFYLIFSILIGVVVGFFSYFTIFQDFGEWILNYKKEYIMLSDHSPDYLLNRYLDNILTLIIFSFKYFSWLILFPLFILIEKSFLSYFNFNKHQYLRIFILFLSVLFFAYEIFYFKFYRSTLANAGWINAYFYIIIVSFQLFLLLVFCLKENILSKYFLLKYFDKILIISLLIITPFFGAIGTANPIFLNALIHSASWFGVIIILLIYLADFIKSRIILSLFIIIPSLVTSSQVIDGNTFIPYHSVFFNKNKSNQFQQTEKVDDISLLDGIYLDIETKMFLIELHNLLKVNNFKKGYPIFGFHIPGIVYLMEGISPGMPYYYNKNRDVKAFDCFEFQNNPPIIMITEENPINKNLLNTMKTKGVNFPEDYLLKGEVYFPNTKSMLKVYFPMDYLLQQLY